MNNITMTKDGTMVTGESKHYRAALQRGDVVLYSKGTTGNYVLAKNQRIAQFMQTLKRPFADEVRELINIVKGSK